METHSAEPHDEIYNFNYVWMCSDNWTANTEFSIQAVIRAIFPETEVPCDGELNTSTAVKLQRCGALIEFSLPTCLVMAKFPFWNQNLPMLQNMELWAREAWCSSRPYVYVLGGLWPPVSWTHSTCNWETMSAWISQFVFPLLWAYTVAFFHPPSLASTPADARMRNIDVMWI